MTTDERYRDLRGAQTTLNEAITRTLSRRALEETAKKLGLWKQGRADVADELHLEILNDSAIYDYAVNGVSAVARFASRAGSGLSADERIVLRAMTDAHPTVIQILGTADRGARVRDLLHGEDLFLTDVALARTGVPDAYVVTRLMRAEGLVLTAGAGAAIDDNPGRLIAAAGKLPEAARAPRMRAAIAINLYRLALAADETEAHALMSAMMMSGRDPLSLALKRALLEQLAR